MQMQEWENYWQKKRELADMYEANKRKIESSFSFKIINFFKKRKAKKQMFLPVSLFYNVGTDSYSIVSKYGEVIDLSADKTLDHYGEFFHRNKSCQ